jgi:hypothetical protein
VGKFCERFGKWFEAYFLGVSCSQFMNSQRKWIKQITGTRNNINNLFYVECSHGIVRKTFIQINDHVLFILPTPFLPNGCENLMKIAVMKDNLFIQMLDTLF